MRPEGRFRHSFMSNGTLEDLTQERCDLIRNVNVSYNEGVHERSTHIII